MKIVVDPQLKSLSLFAVGDEIPKVTGRKSRGQSDAALIHTFRNPKLITDTAAISRLPSSLRDAILKTYEFSNRVTEYDGVSTHWSEAHYPRVWAPSIDTVLFAKALRMRLVGDRRLKNFSSLLEIGCGSGFLTKYLVAKKKKIGRSFSYVHVMDINKDAIKCALDNIEEVRGGSEISYTHNLANAPLRILRSYDLVLCNPPYIPRPKERNSNPFEGLLLYQEIFDKAERMLSPEGVLFITFSSLSDDTTLPLFRKKFHVKPIVRMRVPLKIPSAFSGLSRESQQWVSYLERRGSVDIDQTERSGYRYWETIYVTECRLR